MEKHWLSTEAEKWHTDGIISDSQKIQILQKYGLAKVEEKKPVNFVRLMSIVGAIILGLGIILFVASNWENIPDILKTIMLIAITMFTFYAGYYFSYESKYNLTLGKSLLFLSTLMYGASIFLIAQIYHVQANSHWLLLFWALSILPVAYFLESIHVHFLSYGLMILWIWFFAEQMRTPNYYYPLIAFLLLTPLAKKNTKLIGVVGLGLVMSVIQSFTEEEPLLAILVAVGLLVYHLITKAEGMLVFSAISFLAWDVNYFIQYQLDKLNYVMIAVIAILIFFSYRSKSSVTLRVTIMSIGLWIVQVLSYMSELFQTDIQEVQIVVVLGLLATIYYSLGSLHIDFKKAYQSPALFSLAVILYLLSFRDFVDAGRGYDASVFFFACMIFAVIAVLLAFTARYTKTEMILIWVSILALTSISIIPQNALAYVLIANITAVIYAFSLIYYAIQENNPLMFNVGVIFLSLIIITRYFDMFWGMFDRSLFFIFGGALMIVGAVFVEKKRRKILEAMK